MSTQDSESTSEMLGLLGFKSSKERLVSASQNLYHLLLMYISTTNKMIQLLNAHLGTNLSIMSMKEDLGIKENLQLLIIGFKEVQVTVGKKDKDAQEIIRHSVPAKIACPSISLQDKISAVKHLHDSYKGVVENIKGVLIAVLLKRNNFPDAMESAIHQLSSSPALSLQVSQLRMHYAVTAEMLQQNEMLSTTEDSSSSSEISQHPRCLPLSSLLVFLQGILREHESIKKSLILAAECLEEAFIVLKPPCEGFQTFVKILQDCILKRDKQ